MSVYAQFDNAGTAVDVYDTLNLKLAHGAVVSLASTGATPDSHRTYELRIFGTKGLLMMELWAGTMACHLSDGQVTRYPDLPEQDIYPFFAPTKNFVDVVLGCAENGSPGHLGLYAMKIIEAACQSSRTGSVVALKTPSQG